MVGKKSRVRQSVFGRITRMVVHLIGMLVVGSVIAGGVLAWRLASGPISFAFLTPYFETALSPENGAFKTVFKDTILRLDKLL